MIWFVVINVIKFRWSSIWPLRNILICNNRGPCFGHAFLGHVGIWLNDVIWCVAINGIALTLAWLKFMTWFVLINVIRFHLSSIWPLRNIFECSYRSRCFRHAFPDPDSLPNRHMFPGVSLHAHNMRSFPHAHNMLGMAASQTSVGACLWILLEFAGMVCGLPDVWVLLLDSMF